MENAGWKYNGRFQHVPTKVEVCVGEGKEPWSESKGERTYTSTLAFPS